MTMPSPHDLELALQGTIGATLQSAGLVGTKWTLVYEVIEPSGDQALYEAASEGAANWDILGMLEFAAARCRAVAADGGTE